jgi:hypothetical protein
VIKLADAYAIRDDLVWPSDLNTPARPPAVAYLDQNHFVNMARVAAGQSIPGTPSCWRHAVKALRKVGLSFPCR